MKKIRKEMEKTRKEEMGKVDNLMHAVRGKKKEGKRRKEGEAKKKNEIPAGENTTRGTEGGNKRRPA